MTDAKPARQCLGLFVGALAAQVVGALLHGAPAHPDAGLSPVATIGTFLVFVYWALSIFAWGRAIATLLDVDDHGPGMSLACGAAWAALTMMALCHLGLVGHDRQTPLRAVLLAGHLVAFMVGPRPMAQTIRTRSIDGALLALIGACVLTAFLKNAFPTAGSDEFYYHLVAPKLWSDAGGFVFDVRNPVIMQCSYWEYLHLWGFSFFAERGPHGLVEAQLFARWAHALAFVGACFSAYRLLRPYATTAAIALLAVCAIAYSRALSDALFYAKNDWGVALWFFSGAALLFPRQTLTPLKTALAGTFLGLAFGAKFSAALALAPLIACWASRANPIRGVAVFGAAFIAGVTPVVIRNWIVIGNPVFPTFNGIFKSPWSSQSWQSLQNLYELSGLDLSPSNWLEKTKIVWMSSPWIVAVALLPFLPGIRSRAPLATVAFVSIVLATLKVNVMHEAISHYARLIGPGLLIAAALGAIALGELVERASPKARPLLIVAGLAMAFWSPDMQWKIWKDFLHLPPTAEMLRFTQAGGPGKSWLRVNAKPNERIFSTGDDHVYYISHLDVVVMPRQPEIDALTIQEPDPVEILRVLRRYQGKYLLDSRHWLQHSWGQTARRLQPLLKRHPEALVAAARLGDVYDLEKLYEEVLRSCPGPRDQAPLPFMSYSDGATS